MLNSIKTLEGRSLSGTGEPERRSLGVSGGRRDAKRGRYRRRRAVAVTLLIILCFATYYGASWLVARWFGSGTGAPTTPRPSQTINDPSLPAARDPLPFKAERYLSAGDVDGDGQPEQIAIGPATSAMRPVALVSGTGRAQRMIGTPLNLPDFPLEVKDLPRAKGMLVQAGLLPSDGPTAEVAVGSQKAVLAAGGEPDFKAWRPDRSKGLVPVDYYLLAAPMTPPAPTSILVDKYRNVLWYYANGELSATYRVATGRHIKGPQPTAANQTINFVTPVGRYSIGSKVPGLAYYKENIPAKDPRNPLGTRWLGFNVFPGDKTMVWGIHGTNEPDSIGRWVSEGCVRMRNADVEALYDMVADGTVIEIIDSRP